METRKTNSLVEPGHTYASVTRKIIEIPLTDLREHPMGWIIGFFIAFLGMMVFLMAVTVLFIKGVGIWGINIPVGWGFAITNFVWWIGIGHAGTLNLRDPAAVPARVAHFDQPLCRSNDFFRRCERRDVSHSASWTALVVLIPVPLPQYIWPVASVPQPPGLGRVCDHDLCPGFLVVLVSWAWFPIWPPCGTRRRTSGSVEFMA